MFQSPPLAVRPPRSRLGAVAVAALLLSPLAGPAAHAQVLDPEFPVAHGAVQAMHLSGATLYFSGATWTGRMCGAGIPIDAVSGEVFPDWPVFQAAYSVVADGTGGWYVGGSTLSRSGVLHVLADGTLDDWYAPADGSVLALALTGSVLYAGGQFAHLAGQPRADLAAIDTATGDLLPWAPAVGGDVRTLALAGNTVYLGGKFTSVGGTTRYNAAAVDATTGALLDWIPIPSETDDHAYVSAIVPAGAIVFVGGGFDSLGAESHAYLGAVDATTGSAQPWAPALDGDVTAMALHGSDLFVGGTFGTIGGQARVRIAEIDGASGLPTAWNPALPTYRSIRALAIHGPTLYVGGSFADGSGATVGNLAAVDAATGDVHAWNPGRTRFLNPGSPSAAYDEPVRCLAVANATVFAGGYFNAVGGVAAQGLSAIETGTGRPLPWHPATNGTVLAFAHVGNVLYFGGGFTTVEGQPRQRLAAVDATTGALLPWNPGASAIVRALFTDGATLYAAGDFTTAGGQSRSRLAAFDIATGALTPWTPGADGSVYALAADAGVLYAGGQFTHAGGAARTGLAAFDLAGGALTGWAPTGGTIEALVVQGGAVLASGRFSANGGVDKSMFAAIDAATGSQVLWNPVAYIDPDDHVSALQLSGASVIAGGRFYQMAGQARRALASFSFPGGTIGPWAPNVSDSYCMDPYVFSLAGDGASIFAGGCMSRVENLPRGGMARFALADAAAPTASVLSPGAFETLDVGAVHTLTWQADDDHRVQSVDVFVSRSGPAGPWELVASRVPNSGSFDWTVTGPGAAGTAYLRVVARDDAGHRTVAVGTAFTIEDPAVPALIELFRAEPAEGGVRIEWRAGDPGAFARLDPERGEAAAGGFARVVAPRTVENGVTRVLDRDAAPGRAWWYRLAGETRDGASFATAAIEVGAAESATAFALSSLAPNPTRGLSTLWFSVPERTRVRLSIVDVQGREVAVLADGERAPGRHAAMLDARDLRPGLYFVRLRARGADLRQRIVLVR